MITYINACTVVLIAVLSRDAHKIDVLLLQLSNLVIQKLCENYVFVIQY